MVNYCCVYGCGRNNKISKHIHYYGFPKERHRQIEWLQAIGREDLLEKNVKLSHRVCSRHFSPNSIKNKHLCADAVPTLCLPNNSAVDVLASDDTEEKFREHYSILCNGCNEQIQGFRYKCITCPDYDLCSKCEKYEVHSEHCMLRIPKPMKLKIAKNLTTKLQQFLSTDNKTMRSYETSTVINSDLSSDDDIPITRYIKQNDSGLDLSEDTKAKIRDEVTRVLSISHSKPEKKVKKMLKRKQEMRKPESGPNQSIEAKLESVTVGVDDEVDSGTPEMAFADVNDIKNSQILDIKDEMPNALVPLLATDPEQPLMHMKLSDDLSELMIEVKYP